MYCRILPYIAAVLLLIACAEETTFTRSRLKNSSGKQVTIDFFQADAITMHHEIANNSIITVSENNNRGKGSGLSFPNIDISFMDSAIVTFDGLRRSVHFSGLHRFDSSRVIFFGHSSSLFTERNYTRNIISESKRSIENEYLYEFTQQDYLDAK